MEKSNDNRILISEIADSLKCTTVRILKYMNECDELVKKKLIRCIRGSDGIFYRIPRAVCESLRLHSELRLEKNENLSIVKLFSVLEQIFEDKDNNELTDETMKYELHDLIENNKHLLFCQKILSYNLPYSMFSLLLCFCHLFANNNDDNIGTHDIQFMYEDKAEFHYVKKRLVDGTHSLIESKYIEHTNSDGFVNTDSWKMTDKAKKDLLSELNLCDNMKYKKNILFFEKIKEKKMYYNERETGEIEKLISLLQEENFCKVQGRLDGKGMRKGFACLFSGAPGTGKTETAYQIARRTKRNIMMVDISETKSMWYGESEKKIKEVFDAYRALVDSSDIAPILLFNEADAVIGKRKEFNSSSRAVDQTENTIQNIILQEMENLSGILIATTNLTQNMDNAFERRFLYKITFDKPCLESRIGLWNSMLAGLPETQSRKLAGEFELSGGQIENIARKIEVDSILTGIDLSMDSLVKYCKEESLNGFNSFAKRIGFDA
jgi:hypothetical protein